MNEPLKFIAREMQIIIGSPAPRKKCGRDAIHLHIGAARGEDCCNEEIKRGAPLKKGFRRTVEPFEGAENIVCGGGGRHGSSMKHLSFGRKESVK